jgi:hypothetical protein
MKTRIQILNEIKTIEKTGGVYKWYISQEGANQLGLPTEGCTENDGFKLVYIGLSKDLRMRLKWHCGDKHRNSSIKSGTLSVLRQKINTLINDSWDSKEIVDKFMDDYMRVEFEYTDKYEEVELEMIQSHTLPLNARNNPHPFRKELSKRNGQAKRNTLKIK